ncbi:MAG: hypothetical protein ACRD29_18955 [Acidimicrobiales bacterium]
MRIRRYSSLDDEGLSALAFDPKWSNEGLYAFLEGVRRLAQIGHPDRVDLPIIEVAI